MRNWARWAALAVELRYIWADQFVGWRKRELLWLAFCLFSILALSVYWGDSPAGLLAAATGMLYTVLAGKGKAACFFFGLVNAPLYAMLSWRHGYYGDVALNVYYFAMMFPGLKAWCCHRGQTAEEGVERTRLTLRQALRLSATLLAFSILLWGVLHALGGTRPFCDSLTNVLSVAAMALTVRRAIEQWFLWIAVDLIEVVMWWKVWAETGNSVSLLLMWLLFLANGVYLLLLWLRTARQHPLKVCRSYRNAAGG